MESATPLREITCHMRSHSVTCHPAEVTFPPLPQPKLVPVAITAVCIAQCGRAVKFVSAYTGGVVKW